ncbi:coiled-coil domain-containing protein 166 [Ambystoma mexicanum]|uniref:coiled-coil domain-containing protein 166 n=1 Tax=Ambystoma mexicanum TaxID=8296 RepID=UPI0037E85D77
MASEEEMAPEGKMAPEGEMTSKGKEVEKKSSAPNDVKQKLNTTHSKEQGAADAGTDQLGTDKEMFMRSEYKELTEDLEMLVSRVRDLYLDNDFLDQEAKRLQEENKEYVSYLAKRARRKQGLIITLSDQNKKDLEEVNMETKPLFAQYSEKEKELQDELLQKESAFALVFKEMEALRPMKKLQAEQLAHIKDLERQVLRMRVLYADSVQKVKRTFLQDKEAYEKRAQQAVQIVSKKAVKDARCSLIELTRQAMEGSQKLRHKVLYLIRHLNILKAVRHRLLAQKKKILESVHHTRDLAQARRQHQRLPNELQEQPIPKEFERCKSLAELRYILKHTHTRPSRSQDHHQYKGLQHLFENPQSEEPSDGSQG